MMLRQGLGLLSRSATAARASRLLFPTATASSVARGMGTVTYSPPAVKIGQPAPTFKAVRRALVCVSCSVVLRCFWVDRPAVRSVDCSVHSRQPEQSAVAAMS